MHFGGINLLCVEEGTKGRWAFIIFSSYLLFEEEEGKKEMACNNDDKFFDDLFLRNKLSCDWAISNTNITYEFCWVIFEKYDKIYILFPFLWDIWLFAPFLD